MQLDSADFEVIVSDNSTTDEWRTLNSDAVRDYNGAPNFKLVRPPRVLSPPEHFEFALDFASGDYVVYLTDKMVVLPHALSDADAAIQTSGADIVNWASAPYYIDDSNCPSGSGTLIEEFEFLCGQPLSYDPIDALQFKASCAVPRDRQRTGDYVVGKIVFGCYSRSLIDRIRHRSGTVFGGATHDYSAMIQALSLARTCVLLQTYAALFISLPSDKSLGSITASDSQRALQYFRSFTNADSILDSLLVPGVYASQHNMVAHDYKKFLPVYGNEHLFDETNWLSAIYSDLSSRSKVWRDAEEMRAQFRLFTRHVDHAGRRIPLIRKRLDVGLAAMSENLANSIAARICRKVLGMRRQPGYQSFPASSLNDALRHVSIRRRECGVPEARRP